MKIKLKRTNLSDLEKLMEIEKSSFPKNQTYPKYYFEKYYQGYPEGFIVAEKGEKIIGYTIGQLKSNGEGEFISIAVKPEFRQRGIGRKLTNFLINHFKKIGVKEIFLHVWTENKAAISFYQNLGFKILKTIKNYYLDSDDAYLMKKKI